MSNEIIQPDSNQVPSFEEFKEIILQHGAEADLISWAANGYGRIPRLIRALNNMDPTGITGAIDQLFSEKASEQEQENILRAIYLLAIRMWKLEAKDIPKLPEEKFKFLYFVYKISGTDIYSRVEADDIQNLMGVALNRIISIGQYLEHNGLVKFNSWVEGIWIVHTGIVKVESELLNNHTLPEFVSDRDIANIKDKMRLRFTLLQHLYELTAEDTFMKLLHVDLANNMEIDHNIVIAQLLPYLADEGWVRIATNDSICITEDGIEFVKGLNSKKD